jgi:hypothetical protein
MSPIIGEPKIRFVWRATRLVLSLRPPARVTVRVYDRAQFFSRWQVARGNSYKPDTRVRQRLIFASVSVLMAQPLMSAVIQLDDSNDGEVGATQDKIRHQLLEAIANGLSVRAILRDVDHLRQSDLYKDFMLGVRGAKQFVEIAFAW